MNDIIVFAKEKPGLNEALAHLSKYSERVTLFRGQLGDPFPEASYGMNANLVISYISPWIIPEKFLKEIRKWALNFHPGPPEYPGIGCTNFALYNGEDNFGVTAHIMEAQVDTGRIVGVKRFPIKSSDSVYTLTQRCYEYILLLFKEVIDYIMQEGELPYCEETWQRRPYTRKELNALCRINPDMEEQEIKRRVKATYYPGMPGAYIELGGVRFVYEEITGDQK